MSRWLLIIGGLCLCFESYSQNPGNDVNTPDTLNKEVPKTILKASVQLDSLKEQPIEILDSLNDAGKSELDTLQKLESKFQRIIGDARDSINDQVPKLLKISPVQHNLPGNPLDFNSKNPDQNLKIIPNMGLELDAPKLPDTHLNAPSLATDLSLPDMPYDTAGLNKESLAGRVEQEAESRLKKNNLIDIPDQGLPDQGDLLAPEFEGMDYFPDDPDRFKKEALQKSQMAIQEKFRANADKIEAARERMTELKQKYKSIESYKDGKFLKVNSLKDKTFLQRSLIGLSIRPARSPLHPRTDIGLYYGYRLNKKWHVYGGLTHRIEIQPSEVSLEFVPLQGVTIFTQYEVKKSWMLMIRYEYYGSLDGKNKSYSGKGLKPLDFNSNLGMGIAKRSSISKKAFLIVDAGFNFLSLINRDSPTTQFHLTTRIERKLKN